MAMSFNMGWFRAVPGGLVTMKAKNGAVKAVFALIYIKLVGNGVVSTRLFGQCTRARAL
jgi:hypothetical protein